MMKAKIWALAAMLMISASTFAQQENGERKAPPSKEEMAQRMTDRMVNRYGLDDTQKTALLKLNQEWAGKMQPGPRGGRPGMGRPSREQADTARAKRPSREEMEKRGEEMKANREAYNAELKKILTDEQYKKYTDDEKNRRQGGGGRGPRQPRE